MGRNRPQDIIVQDAIKNRFNRRILPPMLYLAIICRSAGDAGGRKKKERSSLLITAFSLISSQC
jgi:hypothetical protein